MSDLEKRLRDAAQAYPEDVFPPVTDEDREKCGFAVTRAAAAMGRHFSPMLTATADRIAELESQRDLLADLLGKALAHTPPEYHEAIMRALEASKR